MPISSKSTALLQLIRFDKPIGTLLLLWPTLWALWLAAQGVPDLQLLAIFVAGTFLTRSAGCIVNDLADRNLDGAVARTSARPLVTGAVSVREALVLFTVLMLLAFVLVLFTNALTIALSLVAVVLASTYPFMKRYTHLPQLVLGAAFSWGIPMAFAAQRGTLPPALWLLYLGNLLWTVAYDTEYAMVDRDDDLRIGMKTSAITLGRFDVLAVMVFYVVYLEGWASLLSDANLGWPWHAAQVLASLQAVWHFFLIRGRTREGCFQAFRLNHWLGATVFAGIALGYAWR